MIPVEAVEAVTDALWKKYSAQGPVDAERWRTLMEDTKLAIEAAAPHMHACLLSAVTEIHGEVSDGEDVAYNYCSHDGDGYPCETVRAIRAAVAAGGTTK